MGKSIRIHTTPGGDDKYVSLKIDQDFDFLEVLSIKIRQEEIYRQYCSDYGVLVGRVLLNDGFGAPNCKVSIFIPLEDTDEDNPLITSMYPFKQPTDQNDQFIRYNLLPDQKQNANHVSVGTFPSKRKVLNHQTTLDVYDKYYKFTTTTNQSGDYMIFGIPVGNQQVHFDLDLSDMGNISLTPQDLVSSGVDENEFTEELISSSQTILRYKSNTNLDILPQIKSTNSQVNIEPFWGDIDQCTVGITRLDWSVEGTFLPSAVFFGGSFMDQDKNKLGRDNARCNNDHYAQWSEDMRTETGRVEYEGLRQSSPALRGETPIDADGNWVVVLPMLEGRLKTSESGQIIPSGDETGIPSYGDYRFLLQLDEMYQDNNSQNARGFAACPQYTTGPLSQSDFYSFILTPYCSSTDSGCQPVGAPNSTNTDDIHGFPMRAYSSHARFRAGRTYTIGQRIANCGTSNDCQKMWMTDMGQQSATQNSFPISHLYGLQLTPVFHDVFYGSFYFGQFNIKNSFRHCENFVYGKTAGNGNNEPAGSKDSKPPYWYKTGSNGATYVFDLINLHNPTYDFFTDKEMATLPTQLPITSNVGNNSATQSYLNRYWYFGLHVGHSSLEIVRDRFNI